MLQTALLGSDPSLLSLPIRPNALTGGLTYQFRLDVTQNINSGLTSASITVVANSPPSSGTIRATPESGMVVLDGFTLTTQGWADDPEVSDPYPFPFVSLVVSFLAVVDAAALPSLLNTR